MCEKPKELTQHIWNEDHKNGTLRGFHIHIYESADKGENMRLAKALKTEFNDIVKGIYEVRVVGPHTVKNVEVDLTVDMLKGDTLQRLESLIEQFSNSTLIHPETGDDFTDHIENALWINGRTDLNWDFLIRLHQSQNKYKN